MVAVGCGKAPLEATFVTCQFPGVEARDQPARRDRLHQSTDPGLVSEWPAARHKDFVRARSAGAEIDLPVASIPKGLRARSAAAAADGAADGRRAARHDEHRCSTRRPRQRSVSFIHSGRDRPIIRPSAPTLRLITHTRVQPLSRRRCSGLRRSAQQQDEGGRGEEPDRDFWPTSSSSKRRRRAAAGGG